MVVILILMLWFLCFLFAWIFAKKENNYANPVTQILVYWGLLCGLAGMRLFNVIESSVLAYFIVFSGLLFLILGTVIPYRRRLALKNKININRYSVNRKALCIIALVLIVYDMQYFLVGLKYYFAGLILKNYFYAGAIYDTWWSSVFFNYCYQPILIVFSIVAAREFFLKKRNWLFVGLVTFMQVQSYFSTGKRTYVSIFIMALFNMALMNFNNLVAYLKKYSTSIWIGGGALFAFTIIFNSGSIWKDLYLYFTGCIPCLSVNLQNFNRGYTWGGTSFYGFLLAIDNIIPVSMIELVEKYMDIISMAFRITPTDNYNAFITCFGYFYIDGGIIAVILLSFAFGIFNGVIYKFYKSNPCDRNIILFTFAILMIYNSPIRFEFGNIKYALAFIWMMLLFYTPLKKIFLVFENE